MNNTDTNNTSETTADKKNKLSKNSVIIILAVLIIILLSYILAFNFISNHNEEISSEFSVITTENQEIASTKDNLMVNINTDDPFELMQLDGIGEAKASAIIEYRRENGNFTQIEDILKVQGIGDTIYSKIKSHIYVE